MDILYLKIVLLVNVWLFVFGSPVAMLQHATSSQSIVFHQSQASPAAAVTSTPPPVSSYSGVQPKYEYKYEVSDHQTGDRKSHWESREGDRVRGGYSLYEPDGALRTVEYTADSIHGFNAVVRRNEATRHHQHPRSEIYNRGVSSTANDRYNAGEHTAYIADKGVFTNDHESDRPRYSESTASHNTVGFSVNHVLALREEESVNPF